MPLRNIVKIMHRSRIPCTFYYTRISEGPLFCEFELLFKNYAYVDVTLGIKESSCSTNMAMMKIEHCYMTIRNRYCFIA